MRSLLPTYAPRGDTAFVARDARSHTAAPVFRHAVHQPHHPLDLVARQELLILDEPTCALDAKLEALIRATINGLRSTMSVIILAHRLSTLDDCDRIMIIQHGVVVAFDTPVRLRESEIFYTQALMLSGPS